MKTNEKLKYPIISAWVKCDNKMQWVPIDTLDYCEEEFVIIDEDGNDHTYKLDECDLTVSEWKESEVPEDGE
ncbi:hypothetical protein IGI66_000216 [Enterococcus sp. AZ048]|uniref:hypothetical protein n=1 Tax=Enterococcus sp. AZ048 TaxID=2774658 RepID=UPI003F275658